MSASLSTTQAFGPAAYRVTQDDIIALGETFMVFGSAYFNSISMVRALRDSPDKMAGLTADYTPYVYGSLAGLDYWLVNSNNYAVPGAGTLAGVDVVPALQGYYIYTVRGDTVYEFTWFDGPKDWNPTSCSFGTNKVNPQAFALKFDPLSSLLFVLFTYYQDGEDTS